MKLSTLACSALAALAAAASARAQTVLFSDDFSAGLGAWTATANWHLQDEATVCDPDLAPFPSPGFAAAFNIGSASGCGFGWTVGDLTTVSAISIPAGAVNPRLRFVSYEETECGGGNCGWDHRYVRVSKNNGSSWDLVMVGSTEYVWYERTVSLAAYAGFNVLIQFRFDAIDPWVNDYPGWFIDDVRVEIGSPFALYCTGKVSSAGCIPYVDAAGDVSLSGPDDLVISAQLLRNNVSSKLIWSRAPNNAPFHGGTLCVMAPAARTTVMMSGGTAAPAVDCTGSYSFAFTHAYLATKSVMAGETLYVQGSTRDPGFAPPGNHSLSSALSFTVTP
jgi:hypothetical protein